MAFSEAQKVDIRRYCGYQAYGAGPSGFQGWRFFQAYGTLEFKLNNLDPAEEAVMTSVYLPNLATLESAIPASGANLDTDDDGHLTDGVHERILVRLVHGVSFERGYVAT